MIQIIISSTLVFFFKEIIKLLYIFYKLKIIQTCKLLTCEVARRSAPWRQCSLQPSTSTTFSVSC